MRTFIPHRLAIVKRLLRTSAPYLLTLAAAGWLGTSPVAAQTGTTAPAGAAARTTTHPSATHQGTTHHGATHKGARSRMGARRHKAHLVKAHLPAKPAEVASAPVAPPAPPKPDWPIDGQPVPATVTWDSRGLRIDAKNSSLKQILDDVATATGTRIQGMGADQRIFGDYGPGTARDVLSQILNGSGYNILMIGDQGQGVPRQIELTARHAPTTPATASAPSPGNGDDDSADNDVEDTPVQPPQIPPALRPGFGPVAPMRTPQQIMQEMQQRQREMQQRANPPQ